MQRCIDSLIPISAATLAPEAVIGCDIFVRNASDSRSAVLFCRAGAIVDLRELKPQLVSGTCKLYIDRYDRSEYQSYLREHWKELLAQGSKSAADQLAVISEVTRDVLNERFQQGEIAAIVAAAIEMGRETCQWLGSQSLMVQELCSVLHHDYATFTHSTNVSLYAVLLARELGYSDAELSRIAVGSLLHDVGKLSIDDRILTKPEKLDDYELREIQKHPTTGFQDLVEQDQVGFGELMMVYQHHERMDGTGYPVGIGQQEIHPWARICAIVDVFEALTSNRPYRHPLGTETALQALEKFSGTHFDKEMLACWRKLMD